MSSTSTDSAETTGESHRFGQKDACIHEFGCFLDHRLEFHLIQYVFFDIDPRGDLDQFQAFLGQFEHTSFRYEQDRLLAHDGIAAAEGDLFDIIKKLPGRPFLDDGEPAVEDSDLQAACGKRSREDDFAGILGYVDESARTRQFRSVY